MRRLSPHNLRIVKGIAICVVLVLAIPVYRRVSAYRQERRNQALIEAVEEGDASAVRQLLDQGADANLRVFPPEPPDPRSLWQHLRDLWPHNRPDEPELDSQHVPTILQRMLMQGMRVKAHYTNSTDAMPTYFGAFDALPENPTILEALLKHGADPNEYLVLPQYPGYSHLDEVGTPLNLAATLGYCRSMALLLKYGADPNRTEERGYNALLDAAFKGSPCAVETLLQHGMNVNAPDAYHTTAAIVVSNCNYEQQAQAKLAILLRYHADVNRRDDWGDTALSHARGRKFYQVAKMLLAAGAKR